MTTSRNPRLRVRPTVELLGVLHLLGLALIFLGLHTPAPGAEDPPSDDGEEPEEDEDPEEEEPEEEEAEDEEEWDEEEE